MKKLIFKSGKEMTVPDNMHFNFSDDELVETIELTKEEEKNIIERSDQDA